TSKAYLPVQETPVYRLYACLADVWSSEDSSRRIADLAGMDMATDDLHYLELTELAARITARKISPQDVTRALLDRIAVFDGEVGSYVQVMADTAMAQAEAAHAEIAAGRYRGPLHGVPIAVKDLFWTRNVPTAAGTTVHGDFRPAEDATAVHRLNEAGAIVLGKLQLT